jgi:hypothetical protein
MSWRLQADAGGYIRRDSFFASNSIDARMFGELEAFGQDNEERIWIPAPGTEVNIVDGVKSLAPEETGIFQLVEKFTKLSNTVDAQASM